MKYSATLTTLGKDIINQAYNTGDTVKISTIEFGDGGGVEVSPNPNAINLVGYWGEQSIQKGNSTDAAISILAQVEEQFAGNIVREFGLRDEAGNLIIYGNYPSSEVVSAQPLRLEVGCDMFIENASAVEIIVNSICGSAFPINSTLALKVNDELYTDEDGARWLKSGHVREDVENYPLATVSEIETDVVLSCNLTEPYMSPNEGPANSVSNQFSDTLFFSRNKNAFKMDMSTKEETEIGITVESGVFLLTAKDEATIYVMTNGVITEYLSTGEPTGVTLSITGTYIDMAYAGHDSLGPTFYAIPGGEGQVVYQITTQDESPVLTLPDTGSTSSMPFRSIAHIPDSKSVELSATIYPEYGYYSAIYSVSLETGSVISNDTVDEAEGWAYIESIYHALELNQLHVSTSDGSGGISEATFWTVQKIYEKKNTVGLINESQDPITQLPIYIRIG